jgi:hypothetical protein
MKIFLPPLRANSGRHICAPEIVRKAGIAVTSLEQILLIQPTVHPLLNFVRCSCGTNKTRLRKTMKTNNQNTQSSGRFALAKKAIKLAAAATLAVTLGLSQPPNAIASSHSDAPLIKLDPQANLSDVYAFIRMRPSGERVLVVEVNVHPFSEPGDGLMYDAFSPDALYSIHIANPVTGADLQRYDFRFSSVDTKSGNYDNTNTILRYGRGADVNGVPDVGGIVTVGDPHQNFVQTYSVSRVIGRGPRVQLTTTPLMVAPPNVGPRTTPSYNDANGRAISGATSRATLDPYTAQTTVDVTYKNATFTMFAGPREDSFFADVPAIADLLDSRILGNSLGQAGGGVDGFKGFNVLHYAIVIPLTELPSITYTGALQPESTGVGVYASVSRPQLTLRRSGGDKSGGPFIQVNRLGNPLFNEVLVALADKDKYNRTSPKNDAVNFSKYALNPEVAFLINAVFRTGFQTSNRADLQAIFIPDVIRVNTTTGAIRTAGDDGFNRLSFIGGDTIANGAGVQIPSGWPNGRRFGDDVVDIALTAIASGPTFSAITIVGDNVPANDAIHNRTFPYAATPNSGTRNSKDSGVNVGF